jgi:DNA polymerase III sliding clamp (beta) subunit (PCNA family)
MKTTSKIIIVRDTLLYALDRTIFFTNEKAMLPVSAMFKFATMEQSLCVSAFDGQTWIECTAPCEVTGDEMPSFVINAKKIHSLIKLCPDPEIEITFRKKGESNVAVFKCGRSKHEFPALADDMPIATAMKDGFSFDVSGSDLHAIADTITNLVDESEANKKVTGMGLAFQYVDEAEAMFVWGGSGARLGGYKIPIRKPDGFKPFIVTKSVIKNMKDLVRGNETVEVLHNGHLCEIIGADVHIKTTLVDATYPDVYGVLKQLTGQQTVVSFSVGELRNAVDKLMLHTDMEQFTARMSFEEKSARITIDNNFVAQNGEEEIPYSSAERNMPMITGINLKNFKLLLRQSVSEIITFSVLNFKAPMMITSAKENKTIIFIFSPVVLQEQLEHPSAVQA